jgi:hypothetical protein
MAAPETPEHRDSPGETRPRLHGLRQYALRLRLSSAHKTARIPLCRTPRRRALPAAAGDVDADLGGLPGYAEGAVLTTFDGHVTTRPIRRHAPCVSTDATDVAALGCLFSLGEFHDLPMGGTVDEQHVRHRQSVARMDRRITAASLPASPASSASASSPNC